IDGDMKTILVIQMRFGCYRSLNCIGYTRWREVAWDARAHIVDLGTMLQYTTWYAMVMPKQITNPQAQSMGRNGLKLHVSFSGGDFTSVKFMPGRSHSILNVAYEIPHLRYVNLHVANILRTHGEVVE
ncbi:hypothetical protein KI387_023571, partial [Taxus chinensis]